MHRSEAALDSRRETTSHLGTRRGSQRRKQETEKRRESGASSGVGLRPGAPRPALAQPLSLIPGRPESPALERGHRLAGNLGSPFKQSSNPTADSPADELMATADPAPGSLWDGTALPQSRGEASARVPKPGGGCLPSHCPPPAPSPSALGLVQTPPRSEAANTKKEGPPRGTL